MFLTIYLAIVDTRSWSFDAPSKGRLSRGRQHVACYVVWAASDTDISHTLSFYFPNIIGLVQRIVRFVMRTELKASYRTVQYEYAYRYTPSIYVRLCVCGVCVDQMFGITKVFYVFERKSLTNAAFTFSKI